MSLQGNGRQGQRVVRFISAFFRFCIQIGVSKVNSRGFWPLEAEMDRWAEARECCTGACSVPILAVALVRGRKCGCGCSWKFAFVTPGGGCARCQIWCLGYAWIRILRAGVNL